MVHSWTEASFQKQKQLKNLDLLGTKMILEFTIKLVKAQFIFLILCVDDILLMGDNIPILQSVRRWLQ
jgi:hypothetical protein